MDKERMLKVSWERNSGDYTAIKLRELFEKFGGVEDVVIRSKASKKRGSAIVVMSSKEAAVSFFSYPDVLENCITIFLLMILLRKVMKQIR